MKTRDKEAWWDNGEEHTVSWNVAAPQEGNVQTENEKEGS